MDSFALQADGLRRGLRSEGLSWCAVSESASQVVLFGSHAVGLSRENSDWDLLCVGHGHTRRSKRLDLVWVTPEHLRSDTWLGSELATHIASYGRWLLGEDNWSDRTYISDESILRKRCALARQLDTVKRYWGHLTPGFRKKYEHRLRRNVQRLHYLLAGWPVPPTRLLDDEWSAIRDSMLVLPSCLEEMHKEVSQVLCRLSVP